MRASRSEADLYPPVKAFLERLGYAVKGEIEGCDVVAVKPGAAPVIVELKLRFNLELVLQGIERQAASDDIYLAVPAGRQPGRDPLRDRRIGKLCRMLGLGLMAVGPRGGIEVLFDPAPYRPRKRKERLSLILEEHARRLGDPHRGGSRSGKRLTAYRQEALRCAGLIGAAGTLSIAALRAAGHVPRAAPILQRDVYGWFERVARGRYRLSTGGAAALEEYAAVLAEMAAAQPLERPKMAADGATRQRRTGTAL
jgi:hypothetical protein